MRAHRVSEKVAQPLAASDALSDSFRDHVRLACVPGVGSRLRQLLLERFGTPAGVFAARADEIASVSRVGRKLANVISTLSDDPTADQVIEMCRKRSVRIVLAGSADYPNLLSQISDPPGLLFVRGDLLPCDALAVAIVGARHATSYGLKIAEQLGSSLARGIDAAAHRGALAAGGRTIAVLGSGVLNIYPPEHAELAHEIICRGAVISEAPPLGQPLPGAFPQRNRIVSGMSLGTVVVQASERSGALITARLATEQGREVFAVPGAIDCRMSRGCHQLLRDGATLVGSVDDILEEFGPLFETITTPDGRSVKSPAELQLSDMERLVLDTIGSEPTVIDAVIEGSGLAASQVLSTIGVLEMRRLIRRLAGSCVVRI